MVSIMKLTFFNILMLLIAFSSHLSAAPITHVVLDLDETVIQLVFKISAVRKNLGTRFLDASTF